MANSKFTFNFNGENYTVNAPSGTTEAEARAVFEQQLNTGSLTGLQKGQTMDALTQLAGGLKSAASQIGGALSSGLSGVSSAVSKLTGVTVGSPMNVADFVKVGVGAATKIGSLAASQVQGLLAQSASTANQPTSAYSLTQGIGKFGINPTQLESAGFLKPGTLAQYGKNAVVTQADRDEAQKINAAGGNITPEQVANNRQIQGVLNTPAVWTGKNGLGNLDSLLGDTNAQASVQVGLLKDGFNSLNKAGIIPKDISSAQLGSLVQAAGKFGSAATALWSKGAAPGDLVNKLNDIAKQGQFAINFTDQKIPEGAAGEIVATGAKNTVNRKVLNQSVTAFIGSAKVPQINYGQEIVPATTTSSGAPAAISSAPKSADAAILEGKIEGKEAGLRQRQDLLSAALAAGDEKQAAYWREKISEIEREIAQLRDELSKLG